VGTELPVGRRFLAQALGHPVREPIVGSSPFCSSPTGASHMKRRMATVGLVTVSL